MNLSSLLAARTAKGRPIRIGLIGAGKFGSMVLAQAKHITGYQVVGIADLDADKARASLARTGWEAETYNARSHPLVGLRHGLAAIDAGKHVIMVNVEADVLCGPVLADRARAQGVVYSMAYGDQPAVMCELVDWVHNCGFELVSAGKGMNFAPPYRYSTPDTVWEFFGWSEEEVATFRAPNEYTRACFQQYGLLTDPSGWYGSMWRPFHLIGLETSVSVLSACLRGEATGNSTRWRGDAVATAKGDFAAGDMLDGEGGYKVWAKAIPAHRSHDLNALPIGLAHHIKLKRAVQKDQIITLDDVEIVDEQDIFDLRIEQHAFLDG